MGACNCSLNLLFFLKQHPNIVERAWGAHRPTYSHWIFHFVLKIGFQTSSEIHFLSQSGWDHLHFPNFVEKPSALDTSLRDHILNINLSMMTLRTSCPFMTILSFPSSFYFSLSFSFFLSLTLSLSLSLTLSLSLSPSLSLSLSKH